MAASSTAQRKSQPSLQHFFAPCPRGLEALLADELSKLDASAPKPVEGGVAFSADWRAAYRVNLESRLASRVLWKLGEWSYRNEDDVYRVVRAYPWRERFDARLTIRVNVSAIASPLRSLDFITLRIKDAICDRFRADSGQRPNVDTAAPDVLVHVFFDASKLTLYLDTSGDPLFKRGWRKQAGEAPLRENLAAGIVQLSGWQPGQPLLDPMCGAGTLLVEGAMLGLRIAPGLSRRFAFEKLHGFDRTLWEGVIANARSAELPRRDLTIFGADLYGEQLKLARANLQSAGLGDLVDLKQANVLELRRPAEAGVLIANPPYGVRLGEQDALVQLYPKLGDALKQKFAGWSAAIFTADMRLAKLIGLKPSRRIPLYNGALECRLYTFELVAGSARRAARTATNGTDEEDKSGLRT